MINTYSIYYFRRSNALTYRVKEIPAPNIVDAITVSGIAPERIFKIVLKAERK